MKYQIKDNNIAKIINGVLPFGECGEIVDMTKEEYNQFIEDSKPEPTYIELRNEARGSVTEQLEFIQENGLQAWIDRDDAIRVEFPKPADIPIIEVEVSE